MEQNHEEIAVNGDRTTLQADQPAPMNPVPPTPPTPPIPPAAVVPTANGTATATLALKKAKAKAKAHARKVKAAKTTSPKVWASSLGGAIAFSFWTIATATFWKNTFSPETLAALVGSTTTIVAAAAAFLKADRLRSGG